MRLLIDANVSVRIVAHLRVDGHDVASIRESDHNAADETILRQAVRERRSVITYDKDFGDLVFEAGMTHCGVILIRAKDETYLSHAKLLKDFLQQRSEKEIQENFWVLTDSGYRRAV